MESFGSSLHALVARELLSLIHTTSDSECFHECVSCRACTWGGHQVAWAQPASTGVAMLLWHAWKSGLNSDVECSLKFLCSIFYNSDPGKWFSKHVFAEQLQFEPEIASEFLSCSPVKMLSEFFAGRVPHPIAPKQYDTK
eukprot:328497-Amphidinium_carterae.1